MLECLKSFHLSDINEQNEILEKYKNIFPLNYDETNYESIDFEVNKLEKMDVPEMLDFVVKKLNLEGYKVFENVLYKYNNIVCVKLIIPNFEYFHLVGEWIGIVLNIKNFEKIVEFKEVKND